MAEIFFIFGLVIFVIGGLWFIVVTFKQSILWGIASLLLPIVSLIFLFLHWPEAKKPFLTQVAGFALVILGAYLGNYGIFHHH